MGMQSNVGEVGVKSIRIAGQRIEDLPLAQVAYAKPFVRIAEDDERQNKVEAIISGFPKQSKEWIEGAIKEANANAIMIATRKTEILGQLAQYTGILTLVKIRDSEIEALEGDDLVEKIQTWNMRLMPALTKVTKYAIFSAVDLKKQIDMFQRDADKMEDVVKKEYEDISNLRILKDKVMRRDAALAALGVTLE